MKKILLLTCLVPLSVFCAASPVSDAMAVYAFGNGSVTRDQVQEAWTHLRRDSLIYTMLQGVPSISEVNNVLLDFSAAGDIALDALEPLKRVDEREVKKTCIFSRIPEEQIFSGIQNTRICFKATREQAGSEQFQQQLQQVRQQLQYNRAAIQARATLWPYYTGVYGGSAFCLAGLALACAAEDDDAQKDDGAIVFDISKTMMATALLLVGTSLMNKGMRYYETSCTVFNPNAIMVIIPNEGDVTGLES